MATSPEYLSRRLQGARAETQTAIRPPRFQTMLYLSPPPQTLYDTQPESFALARVPDQQAIRNAQMQMLGQVLLRQPEPIDVGLRVEAGKVKPPRPRTLRELHPDVRAAFRRNPTMSDEEISDLQFLKTNQRVPVKLKREAETTSHSLTERVREAAITITEALKRTIFPQESVADAAQDTNPDDQPTTTLLLEDSQFVPDIALQHLRGESPYPSNVAISAVTGLPMSGGDSTRQAA